MNLCAKFGKPGSTLCQVNKVWLLTDGRTDGHEQSNMPPHFVKGGRAQLFWYLQLKVLMTLFNRIHIKRGSVNNEWAANLGPSNSCSLSWVTNLALSQTTNFRPFQTKKVFIRQFQIWLKWQILFQTGRKHCGKRRNCSFSKDLYCRHIKTRACLGKG